MRQDVAGNVELTERAGPLHVGSDASFGLSEQSEANLVPSPRVGDDDDRPDEITNGKEAAKSQPHSGQLNASAATRTQVDSAAIARNAPPACRASAPRALAHPDSLSPHDVTACRC